MGILRKFLLITFISVWLILCSCGSSESELSDDIENLQREVSNLRTQIEMLQTLVEDVSEKDTVYPFILIVSEVSVYEERVDVTGTRVNRFGENDVYSFGSASSPDTVITFDGEVIGWEDLRVGDVISVTYAGDGILESFPAQFAGPIDAIKIIGRVG